jgi:mannose-6-phosphate isomerase
MSIRKITPDLYDKVWGSPLTEPWQANPERRKIGEIWFSAPEAMPVLVKLLFTSERMSVQVHPGDVGETRGKTEMWHILRAEPGATVALGLRAPTSKDALRAAALNGEIVDMLNWIPARAGDTFFVPAGTIHAIGGGLVLCEVQQLSDITYRLFDYQREPARQLHLKESLGVAHLSPAEGRIPVTPIGEGRDLLAECRYFRTERLTVRGTAQVRSSQQSAMYLATSGEGQIAGRPFHAGDAWIVPAGTAFTIQSPAASFMIASVPAEPAIQL